ncbi:glutamate-cysteine ligase family protein [Micromonospora sp. LOL_014]|uniref:glutamate-cysteine ligase family protein n=1 Tax=Micromonospora sp. LOL_014 TaxID=3345415 RepID=UPI003A85A554
MGVRHLHLSDAVRPADGDEVIADVAAAVGHIGRICFKTGPPRRVGVELEWTVHHVDDPARPLDPEILGRALGDHAPATLRRDSPHRPLPHGGQVTVEPGGQVEISSLPVDSVADLHRHTVADTAALDARLARAGLRLGSHGCDPYRPPRRILHNRRYTAMADAFGRYGAAGATMMCATAGLQVCLDAGTPAQLPLRWAAAHALGPVLLATFANSARYADRDTGWVSHRMRTWLTLDPARTAPPTAVAPGQLRGEPAGQPPTDPVAAWTRRVLDTPPLFIADGRHGWSRSGAVGFGDWIRSGLPRPPTYADLSLHLSTLFPPVRPQGHLEIRYLDAQPADDWLAPVAVLASLFARDETLRTAWRHAAPVADRWADAARVGLADPALAAAARAVVGLACDHLADTGLPATTATTIRHSLRRRLPKEDL